MPMNTVVEPIIAELAKDGLTVEQLHDVQRAWNEYKRLKAWYDNEGTRIHVEEALDRYAGLSL